MRKPHRTAISYLAGASLLFVSCAPTSINTRQVEIGMAKSEVVAVLGNPDLVRGAVKNKYDQVIEVWEYHKYQYVGAIKGLSPNFDRFWFYFSDGKLSQFGQAGDWSKEPDRIYEIRFR
ncbi:hypothetical protein [Deinococcus sp. RIT780]|uniref:hypothetical protein n=1 Tax=Deinococcus sp. RIT780 TaxID=2870472 RepID=UPI001C8A7947|nr:hypothetical protein [Deinococcus sp. RIT780]MBX8466380.1 hypothetical protein [Deinococcus sp. RIT780]